LGQQRHRLAGMAHDKIIAVLGKAQTADQAGDASQVGAQAESGQDQSPPKEGGGAPASRAQELDKKTSLFIPRDQVPQLRAQLANYKSLRRSTDQWIGLAIQMARLKRKRKPGLPDENVSLSSSYQKPTLFLRPVNLFPTVAKNCHKLPL
jgi:hypothetical protein